MPGHHRPENQAFKMRLKKGQKSNCQTAAQNVTEEISNRIVRKLACCLHADCAAEAAATLTRLSPLRQHAPSLLLLPVVTETFASKPPALRSLPSPLSPALIPTLSIQWQVRRRWRRQGGAGWRGRKGLLSLAQILTCCRCRRISQCDLHTRGRIY